MKTKNIALLGLMLALSLVLSYIENLIPIYTAVPGVKLGIANIVTMYVLYTCHIRDACIIMFLRVLISGVLFSGLNSIIFGLIGGIMCIFAMAFAKKLLCFSVMGVSMIGAVFHNLGQIAAAFIIMSNIRIMYYFPALLVSGVISGLVIGYISAIFINRFQNV